MTLIAPSILSADFGNLERDVRGIAANGADLVHVDVMDGLFVPNITIGIPVVRALKKISPLPLDVHLMIDRPVRYVEEFCRAGADYLTIHVEADEPENTLAALRRVRELGKKSGLSLRPGTPAEAVRPFLAECDLVLVMTVEPGFGGQKFMAGQMEKLQTLRAWRDLICPGCLLEVDGGVDLTTGPVCRVSGAQVLVTGSAYFKAENKISFVKDLRQ